MANNNDVAWKALHFWQIFQRVYSPLQLYIPRPVTTYAKYPMFFPRPCSQPYLLKHTPMKFYLPYLVRATVRKRASSIHWQWSICANNGLKTAFLHIKLVHVRSGLTLRRYMVTSSAGRVNHTYLFWLYRLDVSVPDAPFEEGLRNLTSNPDGWIVSAVTFIGGWR